MTEVRGPWDKPKIREATPLPAIGSRVALWTYGKPPSFVGIFTVADPKTLEYEYLRSRTSMVLVGYDKEYTTEYLRRNRGYGGCDFVLNRALYDKFNPETVFPTIYKVVNIGVVDDLAKLADETITHTMLVLLQDAGDLRNAD